MYTAADFLQKQQRFVLPNCPLKRQAESPIAPYLSWFLLFQDFIILSNNLPFIEAILLLCSFLVPTGTF